MRNPSTDRWNLAVSCLMSVTWILLPLHADDEAETATKAGYADSSSLEGPDGVAAELAQDDIDTGRRFVLPCSTGLSSRGTT